MIRSVAGFALLLAITAQGQDLLRNGGFEDYDALMPEAWSVYLHPHDAATLADGRADTHITYTGASSARLDNPVRYDREPANNWSQHVEGEVSGKQLVLRGVIKSAGDAEGSIWLQCGMKRPYQILQADSTAQVKPVRGDRDWTPVQLTVDVPPGTEFVTVRCVMSGVGTVWFDDVSLIDAREIPDESEPTPDPEPTVTEVPKTPEPEPEVADVITVEPEPTPSPQPQTSASQVSQVPPRDPAAAEILNANAALQATVSALRDTNAALMDELRINRNEIAELRRELESLRGDIGALGGEVTPRRTGPGPRSDIPPLVPGNDPRRIN